MSQSFSNAPISFNTPLAGFHTKPHVENATPPPVPSFGSVLPGQSIFSSQNNDGFQQQQDHATTTSSFASAQSPQPFQQFGVATDGESTGSFGSSGSSSSWNQNYDDTKEETAGTWTNQSFGNEDQGQMQEQQTAVRIRFIYCSS